MNTANSKTLELLSKDKIDEAMLSGVSREQILDAIIEYQEKQIQQLHNELRQFEGMRAEVAPARDHHGSSWTKLGVAGLIGYALGRR